MTSKQLDVCPTTDWSKCVCVKKKKLLHCPAESKRNTQGVGYAALASLLADFNEISSQELGFSMYEGEGIEATLHSHRANGLIHVHLNAISRTQKHKATVEESSLESPQKFPRLTKN